MRFVKKETNTTPIEDTVFAIVKKAAQAKEQFGRDQVIDATIGSLYDERGKLVALESVYTPYDAIPKEVKAKYAGSFVGNESYRNQVYQWLFGKIHSTLAHDVIATPGGTGAVNMTISQCLDAKEYVVLPEIGWGSYPLMASMANLETITYPMFEQDHFDLDGFRKACETALCKQDKLVVVINDPCHNPTGYTLTKQEWKEIIAFLNTCGEKAPVVLLNDIAYMDYSYDVEHSRDYFELFNDISEHVMVVVAFSSSKALTSYGLRCGAAVVLGQKAEDVQNIRIVFEKAARSMWSNIPNAAMDNFTYVTTKNRDVYCEEKAQYIALLQKRSAIFTGEASDVNLPIYPYKEGFFVTICMEDNCLRDRYHEALMAQNIFTVKVNKGIRVAICSLPVTHCHGLAKRMKTILDQVR